MRKVPKKYLIIGVICLFVVGAAALTVKHTQTSTTSSSKTPSSLIDSATLNSLDFKSTSLLSKKHVANGLTPPTNKWYSSMVLNDKPQPGFSVPNSILPRDDGVEIGLPAITATSDGIYSPHVNGMTLSVKNAANFKLTRYDELTITLTFYDVSSNELFTVTFASGSPYGFVQAKQAIAISLTSGPMQENSNGLTTFKNSTGWYAVKTSNGETGSTLNLQKNDELAIYSAPDKTAAAFLAKAATNPIISGTASFESNKDKVKTTLTYKTKNNRQTILVRMPHQASSTTQNVFTYPSLYGQLGAYDSSEIEYTQPVQKPAWSLDVTDISTNEKAVVINQLKSDIENSKLDKPDTYFGGKQLQRLSQLVMLADALGESTLRSEALRKLVPAIAAWYDSNASKSFYYDNTAKTIVGREASFGADTELNDHHFHYGYFIYAASVAAKFDKDFLNEYKMGINLLVADIANYSSAEPLPLRRNFDAYAGHSWASGLANYADGNNQESSSEAVNAWTATSLWADVTGNDALKHESSWLLSSEVASAKAYWLAQPKFNSYTSPIVSINWGGKREYKTFFSNEPNAKLAIQLLPLNPTMKSYAATLPKSIYSGTDINKQYGDYILMATASKSDYKLASNYPDSSIDDGNSKAYMMAFILSK